MPLTCQYTFTFVLKPGFHFSYKPTWWNYVHILLFDRPRNNHKEHNLLKMLKIYHSHITLCCAVHLRTLQFSEDIFGKNYYFSFAVKEADTEKAKWFACYSVSRGQGWDRSSSLLLSANVSTAGLGAFDLFPNNCPFLECTPTSMSSWKWGEGSIIIDWFLLKWFLFSYPPNPTPLSQIHQITMEAHWLMHLIKIIRHHPLLRGSDTKGRVLSLKSHFSSSRSE